MPLPPASGYGVTMEGEHAIFLDYTMGPLKYLDAIRRLEGIGHDPKDAERLVNEWRELIEPPEELEE